MKKKRIFMIICFYILLIGCAAGQSSDLKVHEADGDRHLAGCPESPNCVSSAEKEGKHYIRPIIYTGDKESAYRKLLSIISSYKRARIVTKEDNYIRAEFRSAIFKFVDDVEFFFPSDRQEIDVRSASRVGYYDFGMNRKRVEDIKKRWKEE